MHPRNLCRRIVSQNRFLADSKNWSERTFNGLLRAQLNKLCPPKRNPADIREDIVRDDQHDRQEEPDHALEDVVHDEVGLYDDEVQGHVRPGELRELEAVVAVFERGYEEDEA